MPADEWWTYALLFFADDFAYYWFHRIHHEGAGLLGQPRRPPLLRALQPLDRAAADLDADDGAAVLGAAGTARLCPLDDHHPVGGQPDLPVLDPHRARQAAVGANRVRLQHALAPPRSSRRQRRLPRPQLR